MKPRILWIEDGAFVELALFSAPVYTSGEYDLTVAETAGDGYYHLMSKEFDAVIVDIRLPPGSDPDFVRAFHDEKQTRKAHRLGLQLLKRMLKPNDDQIVPRWIKPERFAVFTVETQGEIAQEMEELGVEVYRQKTEMLSKTSLMDLIKEILSRSRPNET